MALLGSLDDPSIPSRILTEKDDDDHLDSSSNFMRTGSLNKDKKEFRFRPISPVVRAVNVGGVKHGKIPLSPLALKHHDSLSAPQSAEYTPSSSSNGVPPLVDLTSSTVSNEMDTKPTSQPRSPSRSNSDWESLQIQVKGRTASLMEISDARLSDHQNDVSVVNDILADHRTRQPTTRTTATKQDNEDQTEDKPLTIANAIRLTPRPSATMNGTMTMISPRDNLFLHQHQHHRPAAHPPNTQLPLQRPVSIQTNTTTTHLSEIHESESEFEEYHDEDNPTRMPPVAQQPRQQQKPKSTHPNHLSTSSSQPEIRLLKSESTASTVIIHDYSRHTSIPEESEIAAIVPFLEEDEEDDDDDNVDEDEDENDNDQDDDDDDDDEKAFTTNVISRHTTLRTSGRRSTTSGGRSTTSGGQSMELFRLHMADRIRSRFDRILMDLDARIEVQRRNVERLARHQS